MNEIIRLENVTYKYANSNGALDSVDFLVRKGEMVSVIGSNGSGKSTLFHILGGLLFPVKGRFWFDGMEVTEHSLKNNVFNAAFRSRIGYIFQNPDSQLFCPTVLDELMFGPLQMGASHATALERANAVMEMLSITSLEQRPTYMLSGGEKKRVAIGAVLTMNPDVLLFDEPMSGLDPKTRAFIIELIFALHQVGKTIVIATHHLELVDHLNSRVTVLSEQHRVEKEGAAEDVLTDTDLLVRTNLIHEQWHIYGHEKHKHLFPGFLSDKHS